MEGLFDDCAEPQMAGALSAVRAAAQRDLAHIRERIDDNAALDAGDRQSIVESARQALRSAAGTGRR